MSDEGEHAPDAGPVEHGDAPRRRKFLKVGIAVVGAGVACIAGAPAVGYLLYPVRRRVTSGGDELVVVARRDVFEPGVPVKVDVFADVTDAWNRMEHVRLGSAWIVERDGELTAFSTVCPHLGCAIDFVPAEGQAPGKFKCPCHRSAFSLDGEREMGPSPRDLDELALEVDERDGLVSIRYQRFRLGIESKEEV